MVVAHTFVFDVFTLGRSHELNRPSTPSEVRQKQKKAYVEILPFCSFLPNMNRFFPSSSWYVRDVYHFDTEQLSRKLFFFLGGGGGGGLLKRNL